MSFLYQGVNLLIVLILLGIPVVVTLLLFKRFQNQPQEETGLQEKIKELEDRIRQLEDKM
ncbi:hypothetical protein [Alkaliphilus crotonatoxidans]